MYTPTSGLMAEALHACMTGAPGSHTSHQKLGSFAQLVFAYGLCALAWDIHKRDLLARDLTRAACGDITSCESKVDNGLICSSDPHIRYPAGRSSIVDFASCSTCAADGLPDGLGSAYQLVRVRLLINSASADVAVLTWRCLRV